MRQRATYLLAALSADTESPERISAHAADGRLFHAAVVGATILSLTEGEQADNEATAQMLAHLLEILTASGNLISSTAAHDVHRTKESPVKEHELPA